MSANLSEMYADSLLGLAYESHDDFRDYALDLVEHKERAAKGSSARTPIKRDAPDVTREARVLAEQWILMARCETLDKLGENREAETLAARVVREYLGSSR